MEYLPDSDEPTVSRHSSIAQYRGFLGTVENGMYIPLVSDHLDGIVCGEVHSHPVVYYFDDWEGYNFPVQKCTYSHNIALIGHDEGEDVHLLQKDQFGRGDCWHNDFYEEYHNTDAVFVDDFGQMMGYGYAHENMVGLDYVLADDELEYVD